MMVRKFESIDDFKVVAEFFPRGKIIPRRILKAPRRYSSKVRFGSDCWVLNTPKGHVCASNNSQGYMVHIKGVKNAEIVGSPYTTSGSSDWIGNNVLSDSEWMVQLNAQLKEHYATPSPALKSKPAGYAAGLPGVLQEDVRLCSACRSIGDGASQ